MKVASAAVEHALFVHRLFFLRTEEKSRVLDASGSVEEIASWTLDDLSVAVGRVLRTSLWQPAQIAAAAHRDLAICTQRDFDVVAQTDDEYPSLLREIYDPPFLLFVRGNLVDLQSAVAIVGTRRPSETARRQARRMGGAFAAAGVPVVSGLALGIDCAAHEGALEAGGICVAVLGTGIDVLYPREHRPLARRILDQDGAIVSEYPPGTPGRRYTFPARNRIISGLVPRVIVVAAPAGSGALITVDYALEQGREVLVGSSGVGVATAQNTTGETAKVPTAIAGTSALALQGAPVIDDTGHPLVPNSSGEQFESTRTESAEVLAGGPVAQMRGLLYGGAHDGGGRGHDA